MAPFSELRCATSHHSHTRAVHALIALVRLDAAQLRGGASVVRLALQTFGTSLAVARAALCVLRRAWPRQPSAALVDTVLHTMRVHGADTLVAQAGTAVLLVHVSSATPLVRAVHVLETVASMCTAHPTDANTAWFAALVVVSLSGHEPADVAKAEGRHGLVCIAALSVELAVRAHARGEATPSLRGKPWHQLVLASHPRLRERPARA
jgi:hypothetical protein